MRRMQAPKRWREAAAFSLIELTVVLLLLGIAAAVVTLRLAGPTARVNMRDAADRIARFDHASRAWAREHDVALRVAVDLGANEIRRTTADGGEDARDLGGPLELPAGWRIGRLLIGGEAAAGESASIAVSRLGLTPSYAMLLEGPGGRRQWVLLTGLGGEMALPDDEGQLRDILAAERPRHDAG